MKWVLVGNPGCRRVAFWQAALRRLGLPAATVVTYADLLTSQQTFAEALVSRVVVRFESAAEDPSTYKLLLRHGFEPAAGEGYPALALKEIERLQPERGWIIRPRQAFLGFIRLLRELRAPLERTRAQLLNPPEDISVQFDKTACQRLLDQAQIPVPFALGAVSGYDELRGQFRASGRAMVKLAHGSGGAGCMAIHWSHGCVRAFTTVREVDRAGDLRLYCSKRSVHLAHENEITRLVNRLCIEKVHAEEWLPKARWLGRNFDLRVVTIAGEPRHTVVRQSSSTFTNLNLGNQRGDLPAVRARLGSHWEEIQETAKRVARVFPRSFTVGLDVLVRSDFRRHAVLEVNAFGNLLPGLLDRDEDTYTAAVVAWQQSQNEPVLT